jgi:hypothetical protein
MPRRFAQTRRERTGGDDRADARHDDGDGREHLRAKLSEASRRA